MEYIFLPLCIILAIFGYNDSKNQISIDGKMKRGLLVGVTPLSMEMEAFFHTFRDDIIIKDTSSFIKKCDNAVLIQPIRNINQHTIGIWYNGYVDLSAVNPCIEYRAPLSVFLSIIFLVGLLIFEMIDHPFPDNISYIFALISSIPIAIIFHAISKGMVNKFIEKNMHSHSY